MISFKDDLAKDTVDLLRKGQWVWRGDCNLDTKDQSKVRSIARVTFSHLKSHVRCGALHPKSS